MLRKLFVSVLLFSVVCGTPDFVKGSNPAAGTVNEARGEDGASAAAGQRQEVAAPPLPLPDERQAPTVADQVKNGFQTGIKFIGHHVDAGVKEAQKATERAIQYLRRRFGPTTTTTTATTTTSTTRPVAEEPAGLHSGPGEVEGQQPL